MIPELSPQEELKPYVPFTQRIEKAMIGWERADATGLEIRKKSLTDLYGELTFDDILKEWDYWSRFKDIGQHQSTVATVVQSYGRFFKDQTRSLSIKAIYNLMYDSQAQLIPFFEPGNPGHTEMRQIVDFYDYFPLLAPFKEWLDQELKKAVTPEMQAKLIYLSFTENPVFTISTPVSVLTDNYCQKIDSLSWPLDLGGVTGGQKEVIHRATAGLTEIAYAASEPEANAWRYTRQDCCDFLKFMTDSRYGVRFFYDYLQLASKGKVLYPPQIAYLFYCLRNDLGKKSTPEALEEYYNTHPRLNEGLFWYAQDINIIVTGGNRFVEWPDLLLHIDPYLQKEGSSLAVFSGPITTALQRACFAGLSRCVTVDTASLEEMERQGMSIDCELIDRKNAPYSPTTTPFLDIHGITHRHHQRKLPANLQDLIQEGPFALVEDTRGSLLFLEEQEQLDHLVYLLQLAQPGTIMVFSKGISRDLFVDLYLQKQQDNSLRLVDCRTTLATEKNGHAGTISYNFLPEFVRDFHWVAERKGIGLYFDADETEALKEVFQNILLDRIKSGDTFAFRCFNKHIRFILGLPREKPLTGFEKSYFSDFDRFFDKETTLLLLSLTAARMGVTTARQGVFYPFRVYCKLAYHYFRGIGPHPPQPGYQSNLIVQ